MARDLLKLTVAEISQRFLNENHPTSPALLKSMRRDPRKGVRRIYDVVMKERKNEQSEWNRIERMQSFERRLWERGREHVAGVDEVGVGPLAGPVVAAAVVFPPGVFILHVDDSKRIDPGRRASLERQIRQNALGVGIGVANVAEIDRLNIYHAGALAMRRAVENLPLRPAHILVDAKQIPDLAIPQNSLTRGDALSFSIAAASIVAKVFRDQLMIDLDSKYPQYGLAQHKGYATAEHQAALRQHGWSAIHRESYPFIRELCGKYSPLFYSLKADLLQTKSEEDASIVEAKLTACRSALSRSERKKLRFLLRRSRRTFSAQCSYDE